MLSGSEASEATIGWYGCQGAGQLRPGNHTNQSSPP